VKVPDEVQTVKGLQILMISYWDFQEKGIQVIERTPLYFAGRGAQIKFFVHSEQTAYPSEKIDVHPNICVYRFRLPLRFLSVIPKINRIRQLFFFAIYCLYYALRIYRQGIKPDVIYAAECDAILIGSLLRRIYRVPLIARYYGISTILLNKPYSHFFYFLGLTRKSDMAIVTDDGTISLQELTRINRKTKNFKFWRNGVDRISLDSQRISEIASQLNLERNDFLLMTNSRLYGWKRVDRAVRLMPFLLTRTSLPLKLMIVGDGPEKQNLNILARKLGVQQAILFTGWVKHTDIYNFYSLASVFLSFYEMSNIGNPLLEALNSGKCIVTLNTGGTSGIIKNGENGILVDREEEEVKLTERLASIIKHLIENEGYRLKLEQGAREYARKFLWTWEERLEVEWKSVQELVITHKARTAR